MLFALADPTLPARLRELLSRPLPNDAEHAEALAALRVHPAMDQAREVLEQWADRARERLTALPDCDAKTAMNSLVDSVAYRKV